MENLPYQEAFPLSMEDTMGLTGYSDTENDFELPPVDINDEELEGLLKSHKPFSSSRKQSQNNNAEELFIVFPTAQPIARPDPLKIPVSPSQRQQSSSPQSLSRSLRSSSPSGKSTKQKIVDSDGLLVQSILPPHHLRKSKQSFSLPNLVVAKSQDFDEAQQWPGFAIEEALNLPDFQSNNTNKKGKGKQIFSSTTGGLGMLNQQFNQSAARTPLSPSRKSFSVNNAQDVQNQRCAVVCTLFAFVNLDVQLEWTWSCSWKMQSKKFIRKLVIGNREPTPHPPPGTTFTSCVYSHVLNSFFFKGNHQIYEQP